MTIKDIVENKKLTIAQAERMLMDDFAMMLFIERRPGEKDAELAERMKQALREHQAREAMQKALEEE